ncbi:DUF1361 domain-containing protein [Leucobacter sp. GX24907]
MVTLAIGALCLNLYAVVLVLARALVYRTKLYRPMLWNIWLSVAPILILLVAIVAWIILLLVSRPLAYAAITLLGIAWLLMLPNASYLITELNQSQRKDDDPVPLWFDIILVITLAMSGVVNTVINVLAAHTLLALSLDDIGVLSYVRAPVLIAVGGVLILIAFGMYLGRYPRFNSWDIRHPSSFVKKMRDHFSDRQNVLVCFGFTLTYAVFLGLIYLITAGPVIETILDLETLRGLRML